MNPPATSVAYFGPEATFTQEALLTQPDLAAADLRPLPSITPVLDAVARGEVDLGFVPIENGIEGTVSATIDGLIHDVDLHIQREVVMDIHLHLMARPGTGLGDIRARVLLPPRPGPVPEVPGPDAARRGTAGRQLHRGRGPGARRVRRPGEAAIAPRLAAERYGLAIVAEDVEDHPENQTRFVLVARTRVPAPRGTTRRASSASSGPTTPGACTASSGSSRRATST